MFKEKCKLGSENYGNLREFLQIPNIFAGHPGKRNRFSYNGQVYQFPISKKFCLFNLKIKFQVISFLKFFFLFF